MEIQLLQSCFTASLVGLKLEEAQKLQKIHILFQFLNLYILLQLGFIWLKGRKARLMKNSIPQSQVIWDMLLQ